TSSRDIPMPLSLMVRVFASLSKLIQIFKSASPSYRSPLETASKRSLSAASDALETSSRRKISLFEYNEWIIKCSNCLASVWKPRVSLRASTVIFLLLITCTKLRWKSLYRRVRSKWGMGMGIQGEFLADSHIEDIKKAAR